MGDLNHPCQACEIVAGRIRPVGGVVLREGPFVVYGSAVPSPLKGWLILTTARHARALYDLDDDELLGLGPLAARVMKAQREALGADHAYAVALGDQLHHFHLHLYPRFPDSPPDLRGGRLFSGAPMESLPAAEIEAAAFAVRDRLAAS